MNIFHYHPETGVYLGQGKADPSPLEPDVWLIPAQATTEKPPKPGDGKQVIWVNGSWKVEPIPEPEPEPIPDLITGLEPAPVLTTEQKLNAAGLTVAELKELFGLE